MKVYLLVMSDNYKYIIKSFFIYCALFLGSLESYGQTPLLKVLDKSDGLPSNFVYRVLEDMDGFIWICTDGGVCKYDGQTMRCFDQTDGLPDKDIYKITLDDLGRIWLLHVSNKIAFIQNDSIHVFSTSSKSAIQVQYRNEEGQQGIVIGSNAYSIDHNNNIKHEPYFETLSNSKGLVWRNLFFSSPTEKDTLFVKNLESGSIKYLPEIEVDNQAITQYHEPTQTFQIYTGNKIYIYDQRLVFKETIEVVEPKGLNILSALKDRWGNVWVCTRKGIFFQSYSQRMHLITTQENTKNINFIRIEESKMGPILIDDIGGIHRFVSDSLLLIDKRELFSGQIYSAEIKENYLYLSSGQTGLIRVDLSKGFNSELIVFGSKSVTVLDSSRAISAGRNFRNIDIESKKSTIVKRGYCKSIAYDYKNKTIWINTNDSLYIYNDSDQIVLKKVISFPLIENIRYVGSGKTLITTVEGKNYICNNTDCLELQFAEDVHVRTIKISKDNIWLNTDDGILRSRLQDLDSDYLFEEYFDYGSLQNDVVVNDILVYEDHLILGTDYGMIKIDEISIPEKITSIPITITNINNLEIDSSRITLDYTDRNITIDYSARYFTNRSKLRFEYFLEGTEFDTVATLNQEARYVDLPTGEYTFKVKAVDVFGNQSKYAELSIRIKKPWYHRPSLYIVGFLILSLMGYRIFKSYMRRVNNKNELQQQFAELELSALQSQMNPHFVFNAMNSIQNLITSNRPEEADIYVTRLATLMRKYLESSKEKYISIKEELEIVKLYLQLEELRFGKKISYHIDNQLDLGYESKRIPATIVQPFVENSLKHGLFHKTNNGNLYLRLYNDDDNIYIEIEDDGVGRKKVKSIQEKNNRKYESTGMKSIESKLSVLRKLDKVDIEYSVIDLFDGEKSAGTKVIIRMRNN